MKRFLKRVYWICIAICVFLIIFYDSSTSEGVLGFFALAILIIVPVAIRFNRSSGDSAEKWYRRRKEEIHADQIDYQTNMQIYRNMKNKAEELKRRANSTGGYERKQLLKEAERMERDAQKYYRSLI